MPENILQFVKFAAVGCVNTLIDWAVYFLILKTLSPEGIIYYTAAKGFSYFCGVVNSFFLNRCWTFIVYSNGNEKIRFLKFVFVSAISLGINAGSLFIFLYLGAYHPVALFLATATSFSFNFSFSKFWVFGSNKIEPKTTER